MLFVKEKHFDSVDVLVVGSSMSLNNVNTESVTQHFGKAYLNLSSWGQNLEEDYRLIKVFAKHLKPRVILISGNYMDFNESPRNIQFDLVEKYVYENSFFSSLYQSLGFSSFRSSKELYTYRQKSFDHNYEYLGFDANGGVNFDPLKFNISPVRWKGNSIEKFSFSERNYHYLDSISSFCSVNNVLFAYIQTPFRKEYYSLLTENDLNKYRIHTEKIKSVLDKRSQRFINMSDSSWHDSLFVDYSHLNKIGSKKFTDYFLSQIPKTGSVQ